MTIQKTTIREQIYTIVRQRILSGELELGEKINIMALSAELNVSNTPVREALSMLERDGLIKVTPNAGPRVIEYSPELFASVEKAVEALMLHPLVNSWSLAKKLIADYNEAYGEKILGGKA